MTEKQSLFIPCYNCEKQILRVLNKIDDDLLSALDKVVLIDNKSQDQTVMIIRDFLSKHPQFAPRFVLIKHEKNYGLGASFKTAVAYAEASKQDYIYWFHGDDQASIDDLKRIIRLVKNESPEVVFGARFMKKSQLYNYSLIRRIGNRIFNWIFSLFLGFRIYDIGSGLNVYRVSSLPLDEITKWPNHIAFCIQLLFCFCSNKKKPRFEPISWYEKDQVSNARNIALGLMLLKQLLDFKRNEKFPDSNILNQKYKIDDFNQSEKQPHVD